MRVCVEAKAVLMHCQVSKVFQSRSFKFMLHTFVCHFNCPLTFKFMPSTNRTHRHKQRGKEVGGGLQKIPTICNVWWAVRQGRGLIGFYDSNVACQFEASAS